MKKDLLRIDWKKYIVGYVRNPLLKDPSLFLNNPKFRDHKFDSSNVFEEYLLINLMQKNCLVFS